MEFCIPFQIVDHDEFEALELAIEAAESAATNPKKAKLPPERAKPSSGRELKEENIEANLASDGNHFEFSGADLRNRSLGTRRLPSWKKQSDQSLYREFSQVSEIIEGVTKDNHISFKLENVTTNQILSDKVPLQGTEGIEKFPWGIVPSSCRGRSAVTKCRLPFLQFKGEIIYSNTRVDAESYAEQLMRQVEALKSSANDVSVALGFDTEWKVIFKRGAQRRKVSVLQLCIDAEYCYVFHVIHSGIPNVLQNILEDPLVAKVGVCAHGDAAKLSSDYGVNVKGVKDLSGLANLKLRGLNNAATSTKSWSLSSLTEELLGKQVEKSGSIRMGDWEVSELSGLQLEYAATDAFASLYLFQVLLTFPDPQKLESY